MDPWVYILIGLAAGLGGALLVSYFLRRNLARGIQRSFEAISFQTLAKQQEMGGHDLTGKKELIDQALVQMRAELEKMQKEMGDHRAQRDKQFVELGTWIKDVQGSTDRLNTVLSSSQARGQWGERMAEDVLRLAGFVEGVNYRKQQTIPGVGTRPDFTFILPQGRYLNMDVKFPLDNFRQYLGTEVEADRETYKAQFLRDARQAIRQVTGRDYINPAENTLDYVLVFIPSEQVYGFIHQYDAGLLDDALTQRVVLCSPMTLFAVLAVIRKATDTFNLVSTISEVQSQLSVFRDQWEKYKLSMDKMGTRLDSAQKEYQQLASTRTNTLERPLRKIDEIMGQPGIGEAELPAGADAALPPATPEDEYDAA